MLGAGCLAKWLIGAGRLLYGLDESGSHAATQQLLFTICLVKARKSWISPHIQYRSKHPVMAQMSRFAVNDLTLSGRKAGIKRGAKVDSVRKNGALCEVAGTVHVVDPVDNRDLETVSRDTDRLQFLRKVYPFCRWDSNPIQE